MSESMMQQSFDAVLKEPLDSLQGGLGFVGADVPLELLLASDRPFGHLPWNAEAATPAADQWLESGFPGWARSILEQWLSGRFDALRDVVFSRADDAAQRLYYYVRALQSRGRLGGPTAHLLDIALVPRASSIAHTATAIESLARDLRIEASAWPGAFARGRRLRERWASLHARRDSGEPHARLARAALWSDATRWIDSVELPVQPPRPRVLLAGSMPPDERLHRAAERGGASIIDELHWAGPGRFGAPCDDTDEAPAMRVASQLHRCASGPRAFVDRAAQVVSRAQQARAAAVIIWLTREDEALAWQLPAQQRALQGAGVPVLALPAAHWAATDTALQDITRFCAGVAR
jgi:hypothetical protein